MRDSVRDPCAKEAYYEGPGLCVARPFIREPGYMRTGVVG